LREKNVKTHTILPHQKNAQLAEKDEGRLTISFEKIAIL